MAAQEAEDNPRDRVISLLKELFQFDLADLDFGIYRIMNFKRKEIERFIEKDLVGKVEEELSALVRQSMERQQLELANLAAEANRTLGEGTIDKDGEVHGFEGAAIVREYVEKRKGLSKKEGDREDAVAIYNHIYEFFSRYYDQGDFLSKRRVGGREKYVVPYSGEEVFLHWANRDQHYAKTGEYFSNYGFKVGKWDVHFGLVHADVSQDNIKGNNRYFILSADRPPEVDPKAHEFRVFFNYRGLTEPETKSLGKKVTQDGLTADAAGSVIEVVEGTELGTLLKTKKDEGKTLLETHLNRYVKKNTTDYFIHKDLGGFLRRELEYYIQGEVLRTRELIDSDPAAIRKAVNRAKTFQFISETIIDFLAQIEDFQKLLFEKKKLVLRADYLVPIRKVPRILWPQVLSSKKQVSEWTALYSIEPKKDLLNPKGELNEQVLENYPNLVVDTRHFDPELKKALLESFDNLDEACGGTLIHAENFQGLSLLEAKYRERIGCIYIDPPYNTDASPIMYKNGYKDSTWISMIQERVLASTPLLTRDGIIVAAIDDEEERHLNYVLTSLFGGRLLGTVVVRSNPSGRPTKTGYSVAHDYLLFAGNGSGSSIGRLPPTENQAGRFAERDQTGNFEWRNLRREGSDSDRRARPKLFYPIFLKDQSIRVPRMNWDDSSQEWEVLEKPLPGESVILPVNESGEEKRWRWEADTVASRIAELIVRKDRSGKDYVYYKRRPHEEGVVTVSTWFDAKYSATEHGTAVLKGLFGKSPFTYPKSIHAVEDALMVAGADNPEAIVLDYFAGSGSTAHAVVNLNRRDGGGRKFVLVEVADYFDTVLVPRIKKVMFAPEWSEGKPERIPTQEETERSPSLIKLLKLESYEDTLNNIVFKSRNKTVQETLDSLDGYFIRYMLDYETRGSKTRFSVKDFEDPFAYKIRSDGRGDAETMPVDLVETFNLLLGLDVKKVRHARCGKRPYSCVIGSTRDGGQVAIVWRPTKDIDYGEDRDFIQANFLKDFKGLFTFYANGICNVKGARSIEPLFKELMGG